MAGTSDRLVERGGTPDAVRPTEGRELRADLKERLEQLPSGHPSSPYEHDGTKKQSVPDLAEYERPLPGDEVRARADQPDHRGGSTPDSPARQNFEAVESVDRTSEAPDSHSRPDDPPIIGKDGSWEWKGRHLTPEQSRIADKALEGFRIAEGRDEAGAYGDHGITPAMRRIESQLENGKLVNNTEQFALKSGERFKEKLADQLTRLPGTDPHDMSREVHDAVRYTFTFDAEDYYDGVWEAESKLGAEGFELEVRRNLWGGVEYKGTNTRWRDQHTGVPFEVQFHTEASWEAKQETHMAYERIADMRTSPHEREKLRMYQAEISSRLEVPPKALEIPDYRKESL